MGINNIMVNWSLYCIRCHRQFHNGLLHLATPQPGFPHLPLLQTYLPLKTISSTTLHTLGGGGIPSHYATLGVVTNATQEEIKAAYFKLSKEMHPDVNQGKNVADQEDNNNKYIKVNEAYSVLGNPRERRVYDMQMLIASDPRTTRQANTTVRSNSPNHHKVHTFRTQPMSFEERLHAAGYAKQDPDFYAKHGNYHKKAVVYCVVFLTVGALLQFGGFWYAWYGPGKTRVDLVSQRNNEILQMTRERSRIRVMEGRPMTQDDLKIVKKVVKKDLVVD